MCFCAEPCSSREAPCRNTVCQRVVFKNHGFSTLYQWFCTTYLCLLLMKSLNMSLCFLLSLYSVFNVLACINVSSPPHRLLIYESYPGLSLLPPEEALMLNLSPGESLHIPKNHEYFSDNLWPAASQI